MKIIIQNNGAGTPDSFEAAGHFDRLSEDFLVRVDLESWGHTTLEARANALKALRLAQKDIGETIAAMESR